MSLAKFCTGFEYSDEEIFSIFRDRIVKLDCGKWFIPKFLSFQYTRLSNSSPMHRKILVELRDILPRELFISIDRVSSGCRVGGDTLKDKVKAKDKAKDKEKDIVSELKNMPAYAHIDIEHELQKMDVWLANHHGRKKTPRFIINWLNKIEKPIETAAPYENVR